MRRALPNLSMAAKVRQVQGVPSNNPGTPNGGRVKQSVPFGAADRAFGLFGRLPPSRSASTLGTPLLEPADPMTAVPAMVSRP